MRRIRIAYEVVTPESAQIGDFAETGWEDEEGVCIDPDEDEEEDYCAAVVALAVEVIGRGAEPSDYPRCCVGHTWYTDCDGETDYSDGSEKRRSYHLDGFTGFEELAVYAAVTGRKGGL